MKHIPLLSVSLVASAMVISLVGSAHAAKKEVRVADGLTQGQFVKNCEGMGGTIEEGSQSSDGIKCTLPSGTSADCAFGPKDAYCEVTTPGRTLPASTTKGLFGSATLTISK